MAARGDIGTRSDFASANVATQNADSLGQRAYLDIHMAVQAEVVHCAASVTAEDARGMRIVDHHNGAVLFGGGN